LDIDGSGTYFLDAGEERDEFGPMRFINSSRHTRWSPNVEFVSRGVGDGGQLLVDVVALVDIFHDDELMANYEWKQRGEGRRAIPAPKMAHQVRFWIYNWS
jgi:hypothetical protein